MRMTAPGRTDAFGACGRERSVMAQPVRSRGQFGVRAPGSIPALQPPIPPLQAGAGFATTYASSGARLASSQRPCPLLAQTRACSSPVPANFAPVAPPVRPALHIFRRTGALARDRLRTPSAARRRHVGAPPAPRLRPSQAAYPRGAGSAGVSPADDLRLSEGKLLVKVGICATFVLRRKPFPASRRGSSEGRSAGS